VQLSRALENGITVASPATNRSISLGGRHLQPRGNLETSVIVPGELKAVFVNIWQPYGVFRSAGFNVLPFDENVIACNSITCIRQEQPPRSLN